MVYFIYFLFNDAVSNTDYTIIASNDWIVGNNKLEGM
jgi:hypothetical protein